MSRERDVTPPYLSSGQPVTVTGSCPRALSVAPTMGAFGSAPLYFSLGRRPMNGEKISVSVLRVSTVLFGNGGNLFRGGRFGAGRLLRAQPAHGHGEAAEDGDPAV